MHLLWTGPKSTRSSMMPSNVVSAALVFTFCVAGLFLLPAYAQSSARSAAKYNPYQSAASYSQSSGGISRARPAGSQAQNGGTPARNMQQKQPQSYYQQPRYGYGYPAAQSATGEDDYQNDEVRMYTVLVSGKLRQFDKQIQYLPISATAVQY